MSEEDTEGDTESQTDNGEAGDDQESGSKLNARKIILFIIAPLFVLAGVGGGLYFSGALDGMLSSEKKPDKKAEKKDKKKQVVFLKIPDILVNLKSQGGQPRYLRLKVKLELESKKDQKQIKAVMPRVVDQFQTFLRELHVKDLRGSAGIYRLQRELLARVNAAAPQASVKDVLFQEMLIQ